MKKVDSLLLKELKKLLNSENMPSDIIKEFYIDENSELEQLKNNVKKDYPEGECLFFAKDSKDKIHVLALVNIDIKNEKSVKIIKNLNSTLKSSFNSNLSYSEEDFEPKNVSFFN